MTSTKKIRRRNCVCYSSKIILHKNYISAFNRLVEECTKFRNKKSLCCFVLDYKLRFPGDLHYRINIESK